MCQYGGSSPVCCGGAAAMPGRHVRLVTRRDDASMPSQQCRRHTPPFCLTYYRCDHGLQHRCELCACRPVPQCVPAFAAALPVHPAASVPCCISSPAMPSPSSRRRSQWRAGRSARCPGGWIARAAARRRVITMSEGVGVSAAAATSATVRPAAAAARR